MRLWALAAVVPTAHHHCEGDAGLTFGRIGFEQLLESAADARHAVVALLRTAEAAG